MKRLIAWFMFGAFLALEVIALTTSPAHSATPVVAISSQGGNNGSNPGAEPCGHGATGKVCRPDPQPGHGKDCDPHGNGGVNEDHCTSPTPPPPPPCTVKCSPPPPGCVRNCRPVPPPKGHKPPTFRPGNPAKAGGRQLAMTGLTGAQAGVGILGGFLGLLGLGLMRVSRRSRV